MYYGAYYPSDFINGPGVRTVLFVSGCDHQCKGCHNQKTWKPSYGKEFTKELEDTIIRDLKNTEINRQGLTLTGGDPLYKGNLDTVLALVKRAKTECPTKDIWMWTGYVLEDLDEKRKEILQYIDVLVDGKFEESLKDLTAPYTGSSNQRVIKLRS